MNGEDEINKVREKARLVSMQLNMEKEFGKLNRLISALLKTKSSKILISPLAKARAFVMPYNPSRVDLFEILFRDLKKVEFPFREEENTSPSSFRNFAFFESYFSYYIEGTVFEIDKAKKIIQTNKPLPARNEDNHDVLGTYQIVSNKKEMEITPSSPDDRQCTKYHFL